MEKMTVKLIGEDGNAFSILGRCRQEMKRADMMEHWEEFHNEATRKDYDHLLQTVMDWFEVE